jgi:hypothetical protein
MPAAALVDLFWFFLLLALLMLPQAKHFAWEGFDVEEMRAHLNSLPNHHKK